jgi:hypothetical protein
MANSPGMRDAERAYSLPIATTKVRYYVMRGVDADAVSLTYRTWIVSGVPDTTGASYAGPKSGGSPLTNIVVKFSWLV